MFLIEVRNICCLKSGPASINTTLSCHSTSAEERSRLSLGSRELQTGQSQPMIGTPREVPVPSSVILRREFINDQIIKYNKLGPFSYFYHMKGTLWLIPNTLDDGDPLRSLASAVIEQVLLIRYFIVENEKNARRFLVKTGMKNLLGDIEFGLLNEHTHSGDLESLVIPLHKGSDAGLLSESGCPGIADPGADLVRLAHSSGIRVKPLVGPSSIIMSVMASGLNGQRFVFHGYLPAKPQDRVRRIREIESRSKLHQETQVFIEAPYRNRQMLNDLINTLSPDTLLSVSVDLTTGQELIKTAHVWEWTGFDTDLNKRLAVFSILKP